MPTQSNNPRRLAHALLQAGLVVAVAGVPLAMAPGGFNPFGPAKFAVLLLSAALTLSGLALDSEGASRVIRALRMPPGLAFTALAGLFVLSTLLAEDMRSALLGSYPGYEAGLLALAACACAGLAALALGSDALTVVGRALAVAGALVGLYAIAQRGGLDFVSVRAYVDALRARSTLGNAANLGLWCAVALPWLARTALVDPRRGWRTASAVAIVPVAAALVLAQSRGAVLGVAVAAAVWWLVAARGGVATPAAGGRWLRLGPPLALALAVVLLAVTFFARGTVDAPDTASGRLGVWQHTLPLIEARPFLGYGLSGFGRAFASHMPAEAADPLGRDRALEDPHNVLLSTAASAGPLAAIVLAAAIVLLARDVWRARARARIFDLAAPVAALVAGLVALQFHFVTLDTGPLLFATAAALLSLTLAEESASQVLAGAPASAHPGPRLAVRSLAGILAAAFALACIAGAALVAADRDVALGLSASAHDWAAAKSRFEAAQRLAPWEAVTWWAELKGAVGAVATGEVKPALNDGLGAYAKASSLRPHDYRIERDAGDLYAAAGLSGVLTSTEAAHAYDLAISHYDEALALAPDDTLSLLGRGGTLLATGRYDEALKSLGWAAQLAPRNKLVLENFAEALKATGHPNEANERLKQAAELP